MNMFFLEVAMCEKCRSSHFQLEGGVKVGGGVKKFRDWGSYQFGGCVTFTGGSSVPHYMSWQKNHLKFLWVLVFDLQISKGCHTISGISKGTVTTWKFPGGGGQKSISSTPTVCFFFWNSPIVLSKVVLPFKSEGILGMT